MSINSSRREQERVYTPRRPLIENCSPFLDKSAVFSFYYDPSEVFEYENATNSSFVYFSVQISIVIQNASKYEKYDDS